MKGIRDKKSLMLESMRGLTGAKGETGLQGDAGADAAASRARGRARGQRSRARTAGWFLSLSAD